MYLTASHVGHCLYWRTSSYWAARQVLQVISLDKQLWKHLKICNKSRPDCWVSNMKERPSNPLSYSPPGGSSPFYVQQPLQYLSHSLSWVNVIILGIHHTHVVTLQLDSKLQKYVNKNRSDWQHGLYRFLSLSYLPSLLPSVPGITLQVNHFYVSHHHNAN